MGGDEDCPQGCGHRVKFLDRKVTQILMEILIEKEWIWWSKTAKMITTTSGKTALVRKNGQVVIEDGLCVWQALSRVGEVELPTARGGPALLNLVRTINADLVRLLQLCSGGVCSGCCFQS
jgi:hypothetical protein